MKIGIITIYDAYNYGSFLQAFAMQEFLRSEGHDVIILKSKSSLGNFLKRKLLAKKINRTLFKISRYLTYRKDWKKLNIRQMERVSGLNCVVIGSDEVWNIENPSFNHIPQFFGIACPSEKIITYGPSLGYSTIKSFVDKDILREGLKKKIKAFMVRDFFTKRFLESLVDKRIEMVCDPTLLLYGHWNSYEQEYRIGEPYMVYYSYKEDTIFKDFILKYAHVHGLKIVVPGFNYKWADKVILPTPLQFLYLMRNAQCVVTSTFHGTVFSTLLRKQFVVVHPAEKVRDYIQQLGLEREIQDLDYEKFESLLSNQIIDYEKIGRKMEKWKDSSIKKLNTYLVE